MLLNPHRFGPPFVVDDYPKLLDYSSASFNTASASHTIPLGAYNVGDLLVIFFSTRSDNTTTPTLPTGWSGFMGYANTTPTPDGRKGYLYRVMDGTEGANVPLTFPDSRVMTYNRLRFKGGSFDSDIGYLLQVMTNSGSGATSDPAASGMFMFWPSVTVLRGLSIFGLSGVSGYPEPYGDQSVAAGTGVAASSARSYANVGQNIAPPGSTYDWPAWTMDSAIDYHEFGMLMRGSRSLGHVDPRYLFGWSFTIANTTQTYAGVSNILKVGDMLIACSHAESGALSSLALSGNFTPFYTNGTTQYLYRVVTAGDIGANIVPTYTVSGNHVGQMIRIRAGSYEASAAPYVAITASSTSAAPAVGPTTLGADYAGKRNLCLFFEGHSYASSQAVLTGTANYPLAKFGINAGATDAAGCGCSYGYFDGATVPAESATLSASAPWRASLITLKGLAIP